jgi:hypothetical protein
VVAEPVEHEHGDGDEERRPGRVSEREGRPPHPQQPVTRNEAKPCADAAVLFLLRRRRPLRHEDRDEEERDEICRRVDHEHRGRSHQSDQQARERRPDEIVTRFAPWKSAFASVTRCSSSPISSGTITFWAAK